MGRSDDADVLEGNTSGSTGDARGSLKCMEGAWWATIARRGHLHSIGKIKSMNAARKKEEWRALRAQMQSCQRIILASSLAAAATGRYFSKHTLSGRHVAIACSTLDDAEDAPGSPRMRILSGQGPSSYFELVSSPSLF